MMDAKDAHKVTICHENYIDLDNGYVIVKKKYFEELKRKVDKTKQCWGKKVSERKGEERKGEEMKKELMDALSDIREEYFSVLFHQCRLKDRYGDIWDIRTVEFDGRWTILRLGMDGTENYVNVMISADGSINELQEYELLRKCTK